MMPRFFVRLKYRYLVWKNIPKFMNRRVKVESYLLEAAAGKKPLPDAQKCRELALLLGNGTNESGG